MISTSWYSHPYIIAFTWLWAGPSDCLLMSRILQKWWDVTTQIRLQKVCGFCFGYLLSFSNSFALREASCHVVIHPLERPTMSPVGSQQKLEAFQQPHECAWKWIVIFEMTASAADTLICCFERPWARNTS